MRRQLIKKIIVLVISLGIVTGILVVPVQSGFLVTDGNKNSFFFQPSQSKEVRITWRHSVELTPWTEIYVVNDDGELSLQSTVYKAYGAGTPDVEGNVELLSDGFIEVTGIERAIPFYSLFYIPVSHYSIEIAGKEFSLAGYVPDYTNVQIHYKKVRLYEWIWLEMALFTEGEVGNR